MLGEELGPQLGVILGDELFLFEGEEVGDELGVPDCTKLGS